MKAQKLTKETILSLGVYERSFDNFSIGDSVRVAQRIIEWDAAAKANKERVQDFEGDVIRIRHHGIATTFTVRKIGANSVAIERIFAWYSPLIKNVSLVRRGDVRRAKLYYMRYRIGKAAQTNKRRITSSQIDKIAHQHESQSLI
jgi:large subunit ribosomal protein L19